jgi:hypothetical protein
LYKVRTRTWIIHHALELYIMHLNHTSYIHHALELHIMRLNIHHTSIITRTSYTWIVHPWECVPFPSLYKVCTRTWIMCRVFAYESIAIFYWTPRPTYATPTHVSPLLRITHACQTRECCEFKSLTSFATHSYYTCERDRSVDWSSRHKRLCRLIQPPQTAL